MVISLATIAIIIVTIAFKISFNLNLFKLAIFTFQIKFFNFKIHQIIYRYFNYFIIIYPFNNIYHFNSIFHFLTIYFNFVKNFIMRNFLNKIVVNKKCGSIINKATTR